MNEYDDIDLRATLGHHAEQAPPDGGLLTAVHRRSRRRGRRMAAVGGGLTALVVATSVVAVQNLGPGGGNGLGADAAQSSSAPPPGPPVERKENPALAFRFPYKATWEPAGFDNTYGVVVNEHLQRMGYLDMPGLPGSDEGDLTLDLFDERPDTWPTEGDETEVRDTTGLYLAAAGDDEDDVLAWEEGGRFFMLRTRHIGRADMLRYAEGLEKGKGPDFQGAGCGLGSRDFAPGEMSEGSLLMDAPEGEYYRWTTVENADFTVTPKGPTVTIDIIGGLQGVIATDEETGDRVLVVVLRPDRAVAVHADAEYGISDDALVYDALGFMLSEYPCY